MYLLTLFAVMAFCFTVISTVASALAGVGLLVIFSVTGTLCVIAGSGLLLKLLAKGVFSLLKCVVLLIVLLIPTVNIIALAVIVYAFVCSTSNAQRTAR
ncbi:MAG: hypothetical protein K2K57_04400 [Oscillospiraceae bacterium]|nr:hypothetical protein [Oscillospiraceae bacterium]